MNTGRDILAALSLVGLAAGFGLAWPPLGLIVPSTIVLGLLVWGHVRGGHSPEKPPESPPDGEEST